MKLTRRMITAGTVAALAAGHAQAGARLDDDGLYQFDWYLQSFLDLRDDVKTAAAKGRHLAVLWGLNGCPFCKRMAEVYMADPRVESFIRDHFEVLHLNHIGALPVTGLDGRTLPEKSFAAASGIRFTPSIQFFGPPDSNGASPPREVGRVAGLPEQSLFLAYFRYVAEEGYTKGDFATWQKSSSPAL